MEHLTQFRSLAERYDGFILDLWGVIHDGVTPYPGAVECLEHIKALGKPAVLLSNAPRRASFAQRALRHMGGGTEFAGAALLAFGECRVEEGARGRGDEPERVILARIVDHA